MTGPGAASQVPPDTRLVIDTSVLVAHITGTEVVSGVATLIVDDFLRTCRNAGTFSSLSVGEMLVRPHRAGLARDIGLGILDVPGLSVRSVDFLVAAEAARIRAETGLALPDAIIIATAVLTSCQVLVTNDRRMADAARRAVPELKVVLLSEVSAV